MKRYDVPRVVFVNKLDRMGSEPWGCIEGARAKLELNCAAVQVPIGSDDDFGGVVDLIERKALFFRDEAGIEIEEGPIPEDL